MNPRLAACLLVLASTSCVFGQRTADLSYPPERKVRIVRPVEAASFQAPLVAINTIGDARDDTSRVGELRNAMGWKTADLIGRQDIGEWVCEALTYELERSGYEVVEGPEYDAVLEISGSITKAFTIGQTAYDGEVILELELAQPGREPLDARYFGRATSQSSVGVTGTTWGQSLSLALRDAMREVMVDVKKMAPRRGVVEGR
ncbi:MAG: hypothetical protein GY711_01820 [bacterium]|nr:hypothetical protein [bacterium]